MRKWMSLLLIALLLLPGVVQAEGNVSLTALSVGKGDALLLAVEGETFLIDSGRNRAWGRLYGGLNQLGVDHLDGVILTHTDKDHAGNMENLAQTDITVDAWYAAACYADPKKAEKHPLVKAAQLRGQNVTFLQAGDEIPCAAGEIHVLAPFSTDTENENNNSLVLRVTTSQGTLLLTGDMELEEEIALLNSGADLSADVLKVAHHGEDDATSSSLARAVGAKAAVICTDSYEEPDTPDPKVLATLESARTKTYVTQDAGLAVRLTLSAGEVQAEMLDHAAMPPLPQVVLAQVAPNPDEIVLENRSGEAVDLSGWYIYVDRDEEFFLLPQGTVLQAGDTLRVSTRESQYSGDVHWDEKNVISNKKEDVVYLYDLYGRCADSAYTN